MLTAHKPPVFRCFIVKAKESSPSAASAASASVHNADTVRLQEPAAFVIGYQRFCHVPACPCLTSKSLMYQQCKDVHNCQEGQRLGLLWGGGGAKDAKGKVEVMEFWSEHISIAPPPPVSYVKLSLSRWTA